MVTASATAGTFARFLMQSCETMATNFFQPNPPRGRKIQMTRIQNTTIVAAAAAFSLSVFAGAARSAEYQLLTGVDAGLAPGAVRTVSPSGAGVPGAFADGDRLAGSGANSSAAYIGTGSPLIAPNAYGSLSFMFRRGSVPVPQVGQAPVLAIDYLGGPLLDLDGDLNNSSRSLVPVGGNPTPVEIPGSRSSIGLNFDFGAGAVSLAGFDATATNSGFQGFGPNIATTVNTLSGTLPNGTNSGAILNPALDTRSGSLLALAPNVFGIANLGYEIWQDSIDPASSTASTLGTFQYLGSLRGLVVTRDGNGNFPTLAGTGLGGTIWSQVNSALVGANVAQSSGPPPFTTITGGPVNDSFLAPNNGGLPLTAFGGDLGAYLDAVVVPLIDPLSQSFVYLESAGVGANNSFDPVFGDTTGYDLVLIAQSAPIPEPATGLLALIGLAAMVRSRRTA